MKLPVQLVLITTEVVSSNPGRGIHQYWLGKPMFNERNVVHNEAINTLKDIQTILNIKKTHLFFFAFLAKKSLET